MQMQLDLDEGRTAYVISKECRNLYLSCALIRNLSIAYSPLSVKIIKFAARKEAFDGTDMMRDIEDGII